MDGWMDRDVIDDGLNRILIAPLGPVLLIFKKMPRNPIKSRQNNPTIIIRRGRMKWGTFQLPARYSLSVIHRVVPKNCMD